MFLSFTMDKENDGSLPFLNVLVARFDNAFSTSVYYKPKISGLYTDWKSFVLKSRKINFAYTLVHHTLIISIPEKLEEVLCNIKGIFLESGYQEDILVQIFTCKIFNVNSSPMHGLDKCLIYLKLLWLGKIGQSLVKPNKALYF